MGAKQTGAEGPRPPTVTGSTPTEVEYALSSAADVYAVARRGYELAVTAATAAYERLEARPDTLEYHINWNVARRAEADTAWRLKRAEDAYREAGGYIAGPDD
jgi:hypothetical protein